MRTLKGNVSIRPVPASFEYGQLFESFIINEIYRLDEYMRSRLRFSQYRVDDTSEIDLIIETPSGKTILIEIKSKNNIHENDVATLNRLQGDFKNAVAFCFSQDPARRKIGETLCLPWQEGLEEIMREW